MTLLAAWWRQPDRYEWLSGYLASRDLQNLLRITVALSTGMLSTIALAMTWSPSGPHQVFGVVAARVAVAWCMALALLWACRWPTRKQSVIYAVTAIAATVVVCLSYSDPLFGLVNSMAFAVIGGYIAIFHTAPLLVFNLAAATGTSMTLATMLALHSGDVIKAVCALTVIGVAVVSAPFVGQALVHHLGIDVMDSDVDPLCGLLNRRGFYRAADKLIASRTNDRSGYLTVTMVDLDHFKRLNDTHGHAAGDRALVTVAEVLRRHSNDNAAVARVGGEEFLLADVACDARAAERGERIRNAIADTSFGITASVGIALTMLRPGGVPVREAIDTLIQTADAAMYTAKRCGGNQTCVTTETG